MAPTAPQRAKDNLQDGSIYPKIPEGGSRCSKRPQYCPKSRPGGGTSEEKLQYRRNYQKCLLPVFSGMPTTPRVEPSLETRWVNSPTSTSTSMTSTTTSTSTSTTNTTSAANTTTTSTTADEYNEYDDDCDGEYDDDYDDECDDEIPGARPGARPGLRGHACRRNGSGRGRGGGGGEEEGRGGTQRSGAPEAPGAQDDFW